MSEALAVTLYIPCYNVGRFLDHSLPAVCSQTYPIAEVVLIDDGSSDSTVETARRHGLRVVRHDTNRGLAAARNTGIREARTAWVASLDADVRPHSDWLERLVAAVEEGRFAGACGQLRETRLDSLADRWRDVHMRQWWDGERIINPKFLFGNNTLFLREALQQVGGYDERCRSNGEDVDVSERLRKAGYDLVYEPEAACDHLREDSLASIARTYWNWQYSSAIRRALVGADIKKMHRKSRRLARRLLKRDFRARRWSLLLVDVYITVAWWRYARRLKDSASPAISVTR